MALRAFIVIALVLAFALAWATPYETTGVNWGGCWQVPRRVGFTAGMGITNQSIYSQASVGAVLLSSNYYTIFELDSAGVLYTMGMGSQDEGTYTVTDTVGGDTTYADTTCLYLDGYIGETLYVDMHCKGTTAETLFVTVETALMFDATVVNYGGFDDWGFYVIDTLFANDTAPHDCIFVKSVSGSADSSRHFRDSFILDKPAFRLRFININDSAVVDSIFINLYARHGEGIMGGVSGRLIQNIEQKAVIPRGRAGLGQ